jgi:cytosine/adenosine deaminase-related metal-dependent hydrolase
LLDRFDEEAAYEAARVGIAELLLSGCTATSDHIYLYPHKRSGIFDKTVQAAEDMGIRFYPVRGSISADEKGESIWPASVLEQDDDVLSEIARVTDSFHDSSEKALCRVAAGPCGSYSASHDLFARIGAYAKQKKTRLHSHLLEFQTEEEACQKQFGKGAIDFFEETGFLGNHAWHAHGVFATDDDIARLAKTGTGISYTPFCSTAKKRVPPIIQMLRAGVSVGIGTDGSASNDASNMIQEARLAGRLQGMNSSEISVSYFRATQILEMASRGGARCLGWENQIGSLEEGKAADVVLIDVSNRLDCAGFHNPLEAVFHSGLNRVDYVFVNGKMRVEKGALVDTDLADLLARHRALQHDITAYAEDKQGRSFQVLWERVTDL